MSTFTKDDLLALIRNQSPMTMRQQLLLTAMLSAPAIMAQLSSILMQYIDASMLGRLGAMQAASVGLVSTTTWLFGGLGFALSSGFAVQVAHLVGANDYSAARSVVRWIWQQVCNPLFSCDIDLSVFPLECAPAKRIPMGFSALTTRIPTLPFKAALGVDRNCRRGLTGKRSTGSGMLRNSRGIGFF